MRWRAAGATEGRERLSGRRRRDGWQKFIMPGTHEIPRARLQSIFAGFAKFSQTLFWRRCLFAAFIFHAIMAPLEAKQEWRHAASFWRLSVINPRIGPDDNLDTEFRPMAMCFLKSVVIFNPAIHEDSIFLLQGDHQFSNWNTFSCVSNLSVRSNGNHKNLWLVNVPLLRKIETVWQPEISLLVMQTDVTNDMPRGSGARVLPAGNYHPSEDSSIWMQACTDIHVVLEYERAFCAYERTFRVLSLFADGFKLLPANAKHSKSRPPEGRGERCDHNASQRSHSPLIYVNHSENTYAVQLKPGEELDDEELFFMKGMEGLVILVCLYAISKRM